MGEITEITCKSCGAVWRRRTGRGMRLITLEDAVRSFPKDTEKEILEYAGQMPFPDYDYFMEAAVCLHCADIVSVPVLRLNQRKEQQSREYVGVCDRCKRQPALIKDTKKARCPVCGEGVLRFGPVGLWD